MAKYRNSKTTKSGQNTTNLSIDVNLYNTYPKKNLYFGHPQKQLKF